MILAVVPSSLKWTISVAPRAFSFELLGRKRHTTLMLFDMVMLSRAERDSRLMQQQHTPSRGVSVRSLNKFLLCFLVHFIFDELHQLVVIG
jgi:hypothetical protein